MEQIQSFLPLVLMAAAFWFLIIRPNRKKQAAMVSMIAALGPGARVITSSGVKGTIISMGESEVVLEIAPGVHTTWTKGAITKVEKAD
ncbi:MAG: preprotein translocase subunit YajC [Actinobacteria bacterium]|nr:MAG: preprotein translocase subunit YajC [Actinomycetota bacterium]